MKRPPLKSLILGCLVAASSASADDGQAFDDRFYLAPTGALARSRLNDTDRLVWGGELALGKAVAPHFGLELLGDYLHYRFKDAAGHQSDRDIYGGGLGANLYILPSNEGLFVHADAEGGNHFVYNAGLGVDAPLLGHAIYFRSDVLYHLETGGRGEPLLRIGFRIPLGGQAPPPVVATEPPAEVVPVEPTTPPPDSAPPVESSLVATCQTPSEGQPINLEGCKVGDVLVLRGVNFDFDKATLTANAKILLDQVADALLARMDVNVEFDGYTDGKGSAAYNQRLSEARAASVVKFLAGRGIERRRMVSQGFGKQNPVADNNTDEGRERNRRVELKVISSGVSSGPSVEAGPSAHQSVVSAAHKHHAAHASRRHEAGKALDQKGDDSPTPAESTSAQSSEPAGTPDSGEPASSDQSESSPRTGESPVQPADAAAPAESAPAVSAPSGSQASSGSALSSSTASPPASSSPAITADGDVPTEPAPAPPSTPPPQALPDTSADSNSTRNEAVSTDHSASPPTTSPSSTTASAPSDASEVKTEPAPAP